MSKRVKVLTAQSRTSAEAVWVLTRTVFAEHKPLDREIAAYFRGNRKYGSSDRRFIAETLFAVFRWWGWLSKLTQDPKRIWQLPANRSASDHEWLSILLATQVLERDSIHPIAVCWKNTLKESGMNLPYHMRGIGDETLAAKARGFADVFKLSKVPQWQELVPKWFFRELPRRLGKDKLKALVTILQERPPLWLRAQCPDIAKLVRELEKEELKVTVDGDVSNALSVENASVNLYELAAFKSGLFEVQDLASQTIGIVCNARPGERWWDVCAGAGGKSLQLASMMNNKGSIVATDIREHKLEDLKKRARRGQFHNIVAKGWDGKDFPGRPGSFDGVLVDAPCSCTGTWRRNPDARWTTQKEELSEFPTMQRGILNKVVDALKSGGRLVYATCSMCRQENESLVRDFLEAHPDLELLELPHPFTGETTTGIIRIWPQEKNTDAMFAAVMRKK